ncbi:ATP-binding protein [Dokdonella sp.]|uniref:Dph6-related ATP pyrophosphatase n=1 Tax=Dokdonella sp. TaxID=2291710 RepID=UPI001B18643C|nr:ATP-binding protein [Dokdonella sp.]MBO9661489.1 ATP-binding protein [Dokdonella sp.]
MSEPVLLSWSGGKDATLTLERLLADTRYRVAGLLTTVTADYGRIAMHGVRRSILHRQAASLALPLYVAELAADADNDAYETAFAHALATAREVEPELATVAFGDLFLADVRAWREAQLARHGWRGVFPLWGEDTARLAQDFVDRGYRAILCCVDTRQLAADFCGREYDTHLLEDLPPGVDPCGENGEFHTCVYAGPLWPEPLALTQGERVLRDGRFQYVDLLERGAA